MTIGSTAYPTGGTVQVARDLPYNVCLFWTVVIQKPGCLQL